MGVPLMPRHDQVQRIRVTFGISEPLCYVSVLDIHRTWERHLNRAQIPVSYSEGFNPHARIYFAAALPLGYCSTCEIMDLMLAETRDAAELQTQLAATAPPGLQIISVQEAELHDRAPLKGMRDAVYMVTVWGVQESLVASSISEMLLCKSIVRERIKKGEQREYDLRPLIHSIAISRADDQSVDLDMYLACGPDGSGRPEEIIDALSLDGITRFQIVRKRLIWE